MVTILDIFLWNKEMDIEDVLKSRELIDIIEGNFGERSSVAVK